MWGQRFQLEGSVGFVSYSLFDGVENQTTYLKADKYELNALSDRFSVSKIIHSANEGEVTEPRFIFSGILWVSKQNPRLEDCSDGGRIFCWVPEKMSSLSQLIAGECKNPEELKERMLAIRRGYRQQRTLREKANSDKINAAKREGTKGGAWLEQLERGHRF